MLWEKKIGIMGNLKKDPTIFMFLKLVYEPQVFTISEPGCQCHQIGLQIINLFKKGLSF